MGELISMDADIEKYNKSVKGTLQITQLSSLVATTCYFSLLPWPFQE